MEIEEINVYEMNMELRYPFATSYGTQYTREFALIEVKNKEGLSGWGELVTTGEPLYIEEFTKASIVMLEQFLIPIVLEHSLEHPDDLSTLFHPFKRNNLAKSAIEGAVWDLYAKEKGISLANVLGGTRTSIEVGVSLGLQDNFEALYTQIQEKINENYRRIKVKIKPGEDIDTVARIRERFPEVPLMVDANCAYTLEDIPVLQQLDQYNLMMIEQPLRAGDLIDHAKLQKELKTPICLDESVCSYEDARQAIELDSGRIINLKIGRVGGLTQARKIHDLCRANDMPLWCGGMLESGVGRAHNIAITSLGNFTLPGDTASSSRYWYKDIIQPEVVVKNGVLQVPTKAGIGYDINMDELLKHTTYQSTFTQ